jgi:selenocysteine lyase/cysteine desulfurase
MARESRRRIEALTGLPGPVPDNPAWYGPMITLPLPPGDGPALQQALHEQFQIESLVLTWNERRFIRTSFHLYNTLEDLDRLMEALRQLLPDIMLSPSGRLP